MLRSTRILQVCFYILLLQPGVRALQTSDGRSSAPNPNDPIERIKDEGLNRSQVMQTLSYLTHVIGPRLTGSPGLKRANEWTREKLASWGMQNAHLEAWGPFGRGWTLRRFSAQVVKPQAIPLIAYPKAWSPGTNGEIVREVVYLDAMSESELRKYKGKLKGAIVLTSAPRAVQPHFEPLATRMSDEELLRLANDEPYPPDHPAVPRQPSADQIAAFRSAAAKLRFLTDEGAAVLVDPGRGDDGTLFVQSVSVPQPLGTPANKRVVPWSKEVPKLVPQIVVAAEHYNRMVRMIELGEKLMMAVGLEVQFNDGDSMAYNTIAEIPGSDLRDQVVMLGAHLDSWHAGTGATDNGAGVAAAMEAVRILQALKLPIRRTIRIGLWSGEEQGSFGSKAYVTEHLGRNERENAPSAGGRNLPKITTKSDYEKFSAYYNLDAGTGKIRGLYLQGNEALRPIFRPWLEPFRSMGVTTLTLSDDYGSDFLSFDAVNLPALSFMQDEIDYESHSHHSNQDLYDRAQASELKQAAVVMAAFLYQTATRDEMLPRKKLRE